MKNFFSNHVGLAILFLLLVVAVGLAWPFAILFALNTLFPLLSIPYSFTSYIAVCILNISTFGAVVATIRNKD
jgi:hypothetical protein